MITGQGAYSKMKYESGVHRVQRVPETESGGRIHTSTATVAVMRAFHFFEENKRVEQEVKALRENDFAAFLEGITASGNSSWKWLQNVYTTADVQEQGISIALALTELFIAKKGRGACRVHGGGFAGVIMAMIPNDLVDEYTEYIENAIGEGNVYRMSIRPHGAICVSERI